MKKQPLWQRSITDAMAYHQRHGEIKTMEWVEEGQICKLPGCRQHYPPKPPPPPPPLKPILVPAEAMCDIQDDLRNARQFLELVHNVVVGLHVGDPNSAIVQMTERLRRQEEKVQQLLLDSLNVKK